MRARTDSGSGNLQAKIGKHMFTEFNFLLTQVEYIRALMQAAATYKPDNKDVPFVTGLVTTSKAVRTNALAKFNTTILAQGATRLAVETLHDACVGVYQCMKSCYRNDPSCVRAIDAVPVQDQSLAETLNRGQKLSACWAALPNPPEWTTPFKVETMDRAAFDALVSALETAIRDEAAAEQPFKLAEGEVRNQQAVLSDFVTAALAQGRGQFRPGTPERAAIDRVPSQPATQAPSEAHISLAESPSAGTVHLQLDADRATSFQLWHKGPTDPQFVLIEEVLLPGEYIKSGLPGGAHQYRVVGVNSRGEGPASAVVSLNVAQAAAA